MLTRAQRYLVLGHYRLERLVVQRTSVHEYGRDDVGSARRLYGRRGARDRVECIEVAVDHDRRTAAQIHVLLPPIAHVIRRDERLEGQIALKARTDAVLELDRLLLDPGELFVAVQRSNRSQILLSFSIQ